MSSSLRLGRADLIRLIGTLCAHLPLRMAARLLPLANDISALLLTGHGDLAFDLVDKEGKAYGKVKIEVQVSRASDSSTSTSP